MILQKLLVKIHIYKDGDNKNLNTKVYIDLNNNSSLDKITFTRYLESIRNTDSKNEKK